MRARFFEIFVLESFLNAEMTTFRGHSKSPETVQFDRQTRSTVTSALPCTVSKIQWDNIVWKLRNTYITDPLPVKCGKATVTIYQMVEKVWRYVRSFWHNTGVLHTDRNAITTGVSTLAVYFQDFCFFFFGGGMSWTSWGYKISGRHHWSWST